MEHSQLLCDLLKKLPKTRDNSPKLAVPLSIRMYKKCVEHQIDMSLVKHLHFYDLQCLIIQMDISNIRRYLDSKKKDELNARGISEVEKVSGADAVRFLKG